MTCLTNIASKMLAISTIGLLLPATPAKADNPVAVAVIGAFGTVAAAAVAGAATMGAAAIIVIGTVMSEGDGDDGGESGESGGGATPGEGGEGGEGGGGEGGGEGGETRRTVGERDLPEFARAYVDAT